MFKNATETYTILNMNDSNISEKVLNALKNYDCESSKLNKYYPKYRFISIEFLETMINKKHSLSCDLVIIMDFLIQRNITSCRVYFR